MKRGLIIAVFLTFCMAATLFMIIPIESSPSVGDYDPWLDFNDDGKIDIRDIASAAIAYGTYGDPTKTVQIGSHASQLIKAAVGVTVYAGSLWTSDYISIDGFSKVTFLIAIQCEVLDNDVWIYARDASHTSRFIVERLQDVGSVNNYLKTFDVMNQEIYIDVVNDSDYDAILDMQIYLVA